MMCDMLLQALLSDVVVGYRRNAKQAARCETSSKRAQAVDDAPQDSESELQQIIDFLCVEVESREKCGSISDS